MEKSIRKTGFLAAGSEVGGCGAGLCGVQWGSLGPGSAELFFLQG